MTRTSDLHDPGETSTLSPLEARRWELHERDARAELFRAGRSPRHVGQHCDRACVLHGCGAREESDSQFGGTKLCELAALASGERRIST